MILKSILLVSLLMVPVFTLAKITDSTSDSFSERAQQCDITEYAKRRNKTVRELTLHKLSQTHSDNVTVPAIDNHAVQSILEKITFEPQKEIIISELNLQNVNSSENRAYIGCAAITDTLSPLCDICVKYKKDPPSKVTVKNKFKISGGSPSTTTVSFDTDNGISFIRCVNTRTRVESITKLPKWAGFHLYPQDILVLLIESPKLKATMKCSDIETLFEREVIVENKSSAAPKKSIR